MDPESTTSAPTSEPTINALAASLWGDTNPIFDGVLDSTDDSSESATIIDEDQILRNQAAAAQVVVDEPTVVNAPVTQAPVVQPPVVPVAPVQAAPVVAPPVAVQLPPLPAQAQQNVVPFVPPVQQAAPVQQAPATQAELRASLNMYDVTEADYDAIFAVESKPESMKALNAMLQKVVVQAVTMSHTLAQQETQRITQMVQPYMEMADTQRHSVMEQTFYERHADLKSAAPVVTAVLKQFQAGGMKFPTAEALFDAVAQNTKAYLGQLSQLGQTVQQASVAAGQPVAVKPRMAVLPSGGAGGSGGGAGKGGQINTAQRIFG